MTMRLDVEDVQTTKGEKVLAVVLAIFLLIGGVWAYIKIDDAVREWTPPDYSYRGTPAEQAALTRQRDAFVRLERAERERRRARANLELRREAYNTALAAHRPEADRLGKVYDRAQVRLAQAGDEVAVARRASAAANPAADAAQRHISEVQTGRANHRELLAFVFRLAFVLASIVFGYWLLARLRRRASRYYAVGLAFVAYAAVLGFAMAVDYLTDYFEPLDFGPLVISLFGIALTLLAFVGLQRYLARRIPHRRVRKGECPFCGYPVRGNEHCERCGREVIAPCAKCSEPRRVGTLHCGVCGAA
jgi:flagellar biogenesis protein FliO